MSTDFSEVPSHLAQGKSLKIKPSAFNSQRIAFIHSRI